VREEADAECALRSKHQRLRPHLSILGTVLGLIRPWIT
jgi:hypothetical protein